MHISSFRRSNLTTTKLLGALILLPFLLNCQGNAAQKAPDTTAPTKTATADSGTDSATNNAPSDPCSKYAAAVCKETNPESPECAAIKAAATLMPHAACEAGMKDLAYTANAYKDSRKTCDELANKLCSDLGPESETCKMVQTHTGKFPTERCQMMMTQYPQVLADLQKREEANKPLSEEKQAKLSTNAAATFGSAKAKVTLVEFSDFECPYCSRAADTVNEVKKAFGDKVHFIFRQFPLSFHKNANLAAQASLAANAQGKFWEYHDLMFENQKQLTRPALEGYAEKLGLNVTKFKKALDNKTFESAVKEDMKLGELAAVSGTPAMFINGSRVANPTDFASIKGLIEAELKK